MSKILRKSINSDGEKRIIGAMITNTLFLQQIESLIDSRLFQSKNAGRVVKWCLDYYQQYKEAPKFHIQELYEASKDSLSEEEFIQIGEFLSKALEYEIDDESNINYVLDESEQYLKLRQIEKLRDSLTLFLTTGAAADAEKAVATFRRIEKPAGEALDILTDRKRIYNAFLDMERDQLFALPGKLKEVFGQLSREDFFAITAPMKRGKSWWLIFFATIGLMNKYKVLFISMEMSAPQMVKRIYQCITGLPTKSKKINIPYFDEDNEIQYKEVKKEALTFSSSMKKAEGLHRMVGKENTLKLLSFPTRSINVYDIENRLKNLEYYDNFIPDVIIIDYADILAPEPNASRDTRHRLDETWGALRKLAQSQRSLVVTASQSTRGTLNKDISQEDIAEDIRKLAHATHMMSLNQTAEDKRQNIMRVGALANRYDEFFVDAETYVLQQLSIGRPYLDSRTKKEMNGEKK